MSYRLFAALALLSALSALALDLPKDMDVGVYISDGARWLEAPVEIVNWKTGGVVKHVLSDGIVRGDLNGRVQGGTSSLEIQYSKQPHEVLIHTVEGTAGPEYQLVRFRTHTDAREFRSVTGGVFHVSGGAERDTVQISFTHVAPRLWKAEIPDLAVGEYGFLPPVTATSLAASGKIYSFRIMNCERCVAKVTESRLRSLLLNDQGPAFSFR